MRELVYLSTAKLRQFQPTTPRFSWFRGVREAEFKGPLGFGSKVVLSEAVASRQPELVKVLRCIDYSDRAPQWYQDSDVKPGDWVQFEARLNYQVVTPSPGSDIPPILLFWDAPAGESVTATHLLLHGSPKHLCSDVGDEALTTQSISATNSGARGILRTLRSIEVDQNDDEYKWQLPKLFAKLRKDVPDDFGSWMAGYARATALVPPVVDNAGVTLIASPLYVEFVSAP